MRSITLGLLAGIGVAALVSTTALAGSGMMGGGGGGGMMGGGGGGMMGGGGMGGGGMGMGGGGMGMGGGGMGMGGGGMGMGMGMGDMGMGMGMGMGDMGMGMGMGMGDMGMGMGMGMGGMGMMGGNTTVINNTTVNVVRGGRFVNWGGRVGRIVGIAALVVAVPAFATYVVGGTTYYANAYPVIDPTPAVCTGVTEEGCQLQIREVPMEDGNVVPVCIQYCPWEEDSN